MEKIYKLVDEIYCINLISRLDRYNLMKNFEKEEKIKITFYRPEKDASSGMIGCFTSHIEVIKKAYESGKERVLIFEDDIIKTFHYNKVDYDEMSNFIKNDDQWEILQLSWFDIITCLYLNLQPKYKNISEFSSVLASSYILNRNGMKRILDSYKNYIGKIPIDIYYYKIFNKKMFNIVPIIFDQDRNLVTDNIWINKTIDNILIYIHKTFNIVYLISLCKFYNIFYILLIIIISIFIWKKYIN